MALKGEKAQQEVDEALKVRRKFKIKSTEVHIVESLVPDEQPTRVVVAQR